MKTTKIQVATTVVMIHYSLPKLYITSSEVFPEYHRQLKALNSVEIKQLISELEKQDSTICIEFESSQALEVFLFCLFKGSQVWRFPKVEDQKSFGE